MVSLECSLLQAEQTQVSQPVLVREVLQPSSGPTLTHPQLSSMGHPELEYSRWGLMTMREDRMMFPQSAGHTALDAGQDTSELPGCERTLSAHA